MSAKELRQAAETLRTAAGAEHYVAEITDGANTTVAYRSPHGGYYLDRQGPDLGTPRPGIHVTRTFHENIRPELALALADLLDAAAEGLLATDYGRALTDVESRALRLAHLINGGAS